MTEIVVVPSGQACGAEVRGVDLSAPLDDATVAAIRSAWVTHHVLAFPDQRLADDDLVRFARAFGPAGSDPFIDPIEGRDDVIAVHRRADETAPIFAEAWHADWSFQAHPPQGTCLYALVVPPEGGDTLFADQHLAWERLPADLRERVRGLRAVHTARVAYGTDGTYGDQDAGNERAMSIRSSSEAHETRLHPLVCTHPESGREGFYSCLGYIAGIDGMDDEEARELLVELYRHQTAPEVRYRHRWRAGTLVMWDNRSVLHMATGGYDGHERLLHRCTIGSDRAPVPA